VEIRGRIPAGPGRGSRYRRWGAALPTRAAGATKVADMEANPSQPGRRYRLGVRTIFASIAAGAATAALIAGCSSSHRAPVASSPTASTSIVDGVRPTIVLVHGAWADNSSWDGEVAALQKQGYDARAISDPLENLTTDSTYVKNFLATIKGPIVLVGHSYGGSVITNAAEGNSNVKALVYVDAAAPDVGETTKQLSGKDSVLSTDTDAELFDTVPYPGAPAGAADLYLNKDVFIGDFGNDLPTDVATRLWATQRTASTVAFSTPSRFAAWKTIPSWYFISSGDRIITPASETAMANRAHSTITTFDGGSHLSLISHPDAVTAVIDSAIASVHTSAVGRQTP
jgi:pimeloyl-ACP methyl ester carboxylesterase